MSTIARIKKAGKNFEILVDLDKALELKKTGEGNVGEILETDSVFYDSKKGLKASNEDLEKAFGNSNINEVAEQIIKRGEIQLPQEYRDKSIEERKKKIIDFFVRNAVDPKTGNPYTPDVISSALDDAGVSIDNKPIEQQVKKITEALQKIIPIKIEMKKLKIVIPAVYTGKVYGMLQEYKEKENWLGNGDLEIVVGVPVGLQSEFYDKLNTITHGSAISEEIKDE